jgi:hypothetical protein
MNSNIMLTLLLRRRRIPGKISLARRRFHVRGQAEEHNDAVDGCLGQDGVVGCCVVAASHERN